jgi:hypothetical protein
VEELALAKAAGVLDRFADDSPGPETLMTHTVLTGVGRWWVDRWPDPRTVVVACAGNYVIHGAPDAIPVDELRAIVKGFVAAPPAFAPVLARLSDRYTAWPRLVYELADDWPGPASVDGVTVRPLGPDDTTAVVGLDPSLQWIAATWDGPAGLASSGYAWGAFVLGRLVSVACTFFRGSRYEDLGVVTAPNLQRRNLSTLCTRALCADVLARGRRPSWSTSTDNAASQRVAEKAGFRWVRDDVLYAIGVDVPA